MLKKAVAYYNGLLEDADLATSSFQVLHDGLEHNKLIFGGRPLSPYLRPHFVTESDWKSTIEKCETIWGALQKVKDAAVDDDSLLDELGITEIEKELVKIGVTNKSPRPPDSTRSLLTMHTASSS